jgi:hypothetical protein
MKMMIAAAVLLLLAAPEAARSQFKSQESQAPSASEMLVRPNPTIGSFLGLINPDNFTMRHSLAYSFLSGGGTSLSLASYTGSMFYKIADPLNVRFDLTVQGTPFGAQTPFQSSLNGLFLSKAELNYRPWESLFISVQYQRFPLGYIGSYNPWYMPGTVGWGDQ